MSQCNLLLLINPLFSFATGDCANRFFYLFVVHKIATIARAAKYSLILIFSTAYLNFLRFCCMPANANLAITNGGQRKGYTLFQTVTANIIQ